MKKKIAILLLVFLLVSVAWAAYEDFSTYTEVDEAARITVTSSKVIWTDFDHDETGYVYDDKGAAHFSGDFTHQFEIDANNLDRYARRVHWGLANSVGDQNDIISGSEDAHFFYSRQPNIPNANYYLILSVIENGSETKDEWGTAYQGVRYYVTVTRDDDGGANSTGQLVATIRTGSHEGTLKDTLTVDCAAGEQNDFQYVYSCMGYDNGTAGQEGDGFTENMDLNEASQSVVPLTMNSYRRRR